MKQNHTITYQVRDNWDGKSSPREIEVYATPEEIEALVRDGYLIRERLLAPEHARELREAVDELVRRETGQEVGAKGLILRGLLDKHPVFMEMLKFAPTLSVARAVLGPRVRIRSFSARVAVPGLPNQETDWHFHQRVVPDPLPPFFSPPETLDVLIYLDDADAVNGQLCVIPGSHRWHERDLQSGIKEDLPGQIELTLPAGSGVFTHGNLWHRARPTLPQGTIRRMLILGYGPCWMQWSIFGGLSPDGLVAARLKDADAETKELLGATGYI